MYKKRKIIALISARLASRRLPNKALLLYNGKTTIERIINNLKYSKYIDKIIVATSTSPTDNKLYNYCKLKKYNCFRGHEKNIFKRYFDAVKKLKPNIIVRVTGDNPYTNSEITDFMIRKHIKNKADFTHMNKSKLPIGVCPEILNFNTVEKILNLKVNFDYSEYMTFFYTNNPKIFKINLLEPPKNFKVKGKLRLTLDYKKDLIFLEKLSLLSDESKKPKKLSEIYSIVQKYPYLRKINNKIKQKWKVNKKFISEISKATKII